LKADVFQSVRLKGHCTYIGPGHCINSGVNWSKMAMYSKNLP
jgi:hypothetical protein